MTGPDLRSNVGSVSSRDVQISRPIANPDCVEEENEECCKDGEVGKIFGYNYMKRRKPTFVSIILNEEYQKVFKENELGSQINNSHACFFPPSSKKLGVEGRRDCL